MPECELAHTLTYRRLDSGDKEASLVRRIAIRGVSFIADSSCRISGKLQDMGAPPAMLPLPRSPWPALGSRK